MKYGILIYCFLLTLLIAPVSASGNRNIESYTHTVELGEKTSFNEIVTVINVSDAKQDFNIYLPPEFGNLKVYVDEKEASYIIEEKNGSSFLTGNIPKNTGGTHFIEITYDTAYPLFKLQNRILYKSEYFPTAITSRFTYTLKLPVGYIIPEEKDVSFFINPEPKIIYSDGQRIILLWEQKDVNVPFEISVLMEPAQRSDTESGIMMITVLIILLVSGLWLYSKKSGKETITYPALIEQEQQIVDLLKKADGNVMWQKQIQVKTDFSKVKVSRILQSLEKRGVIRKEPWGNTNKIHLVIEPETSDK